jgi:carnitine O-acetyltransferase
LCFASVKLASLLKHETLRPDVFKGVPLCMDQFKVLFGASRQPGYNNNNNGRGDGISAGGIMDDVHVYENSIHVAVLCKNQFYFFPALWPDSGNVAVDQTDIHDILKAIVDHAESNHSSSSSTTTTTTGVNKNETAPLGVLTALPRGEWAAARQELLQSSSSPVNKQSLHVIDSALFVLVLDDYCPADIHETSANMLHGTNILVERQQQQQQLKQAESNNGGGGGTSNNVNNGGNKSTGDNGNNNNNSNNSNGGGLVDFVQCGTCLNRWYDKLQLIVCKDGTAGVNFEHAAIDGHTALRFVSDIFAETVISFAESITQLVHGAGTIPHVIDAVVERAATTIDEDGNPLMDCQPKKLKFELSDSLLKRIYFAETALCDQMVGNDTHVLEFKDYGKLLIVGNKLSPDSVVQMSILLAYYKLYGKVVCQYEPVLTKSFYHGRTEAMRSATPEAKELCEIWCNKQSTWTQRLEALRKACKEHARLVRESANGKGVDRHLFALKCISDRMNRPTPAFFEGVAWKKLNHTILSTSNCGNPSLKSFGFGPVCQDGFGVGYIIKDNGITYSVASKHRQTARYVHTIHAVLKELQTLMKPLSAVLVKQRSMAGSPHPRQQQQQQASQGPAEGLRLSSPKSNRPAGKMSSFSAYDDAYGENDFKLPPAAAVPHKKRASSFDKSRYFSIVKEQVEEVDLTGVGVGVHGQKGDETDFGAL